MRKRKGREERIKEGEKEEERGTRKIDRQRGYIEREKNGKSALKR